MNIKKCAAVCCAACLLAQLLAGCAASAAVNSAAPEPASSGGGGMNVVPEKPTPDAAVIEPVRLEDTDSAADPSETPSDEPVEETPTQSVSADEGSQTPEVSRTPSAGGTPAASETAVVTPTTVRGSTSASNYRFGTYLAQSAAVSDAYFSNAVFLGDSRTEGLQYWGGIRNTTFYWKRGMSVFSVNSGSSSYRFNVNGKNVSLLGALGLKQYEKVYILLGINEIGSSASRYESGLASFIDKVIAAQPNAVIYLQTNPPLNDAKAQYHLGASFNNAKVNAFNEAVARVAASRRVVLLDINGLYRSANGQLSDSMTSDGCHFTSGCYAKWANYLRTHTIDTELYFALRNGTVPSDTPEPEPDPSAEPAADVTPDPSADSTAEVAPDSSAEPVADVTPDPSADSTAEATLGPSADSTAEATPEPFAEPTPDAASDASAEPASEATPAPPEATAEPAHSVEPSPNEEEPAP